MTDKEELLHVETLQNDVQYLRKVSFKYNTRLADEFEILLNLAINVVISDSYTGEQQNAIDELESFLR